VGEPTPVDRRAVAGTPTRPRRPPVLELTSAERALLAGSNRFAFSLLHELEREAAPGENIFVSPLSASMALEMVLNGAAGATLDSMRATLGFPGLSIGEIDVSARHLIDLLRGLDPDVDLRIANSIWYRAGLPVASTFIDANRRFFDATVTALDFASPGAIPTINGWVARQTNGKIDRIVEAIARDLMLYLIDAVYFKAPWTSRFDKAMTRPMPFFAADGSRPQVPMMYQEGTFPAVRTPEYHAAELPYAGGAYAMVVVVPAEGRCVRDLVASLDADR
jgi:serine protease inhibitor